MSSDSLKLMQKKKNELDEATTFLDYFEGYHDVMAFHGLIRKDYENNITSYPFITENITRFKNSYGHRFIINDNHMQSFKKYCEFLNKIPKEYYEKEAEALLLVFSQYSSKYREFDTSYADTYDDDRNNTKRNLRNMSDKLKDDIKLAKKFRNSLHGNQLSINDYTTNTIDYTSYTEMYRFAKEKNMVGDDFSILIATLSLYIEDLEKKEFKIRDKRDYQNFFPKPPIKELIEHIKSIIKTYGISNTTKQLKAFQKELGGLSD